MMMTELKTAKQSLPVLRWGCSSPWILKFPCITDSMFVSPANAQVEILTPSAVVLGGGQGSLMENFL